MTFEEFLAECYEMTLEEYEATDKWTYHNIRLEYDAYVECLVG